MSVPTPKSSLDGHCSAINNGTLYVLSSDSFQSLPLQEKSQWSSLSQGQTVSNPACVQVTPGGDASQAALYVIGGTTSDSSFTGLQRYTFASQKWETLTPPTLDMVGRTNHSATYLQDSNSILVYAGSQPQAVAQYSSQTFVISLNSSYNIRSFTSSAPPGNQPILLPLNTDTALLIGASTRDKEIWTFAPNNGWAKYSTELKDAIKPGVRGSIISGTDGSKVLTTYDMTVSPNAIEQIVLMDAGGTPAKTGDILGRRDLTLSNWPSYNSSDAPTALRSDYGVAQDTDGLAVITGGASNSPLNMFDNMKNAWVDNGLFFDGVRNNNQVALTSSTQSANPTATSTSSPTSATTSAAPIVSQANKPRMLRVLGITLGTLCGIAAVFIFALLLLRWRRLKKQRKQQYVNEKGDRMSFQDRGAPYMKENGGSNIDVSRIPPNHRFTEHNSSHNSFAIIAGKLGRGASKQNLAPTGKRGSTESTRQLVKPKKNDISGPVELDMWGQDKEVYTPGEAPRSSSPVHQLSDEAVGPREDNLVNALLDGQKRSSGWSRYFAGNSTRLPSAYDRGPTTSGYTVSTNYTEESRPSMPSHIPSSVIVPPLDLEPPTRTVDGQRISRVATGSPSFNHSSEDLARRGSSIDAARGQRAHIGTTETRGPSRARESMGTEDGEFTTGSTRTYSTMSTNYNSSEYFGGHEENSANGWTPVSNHTYDVKPTGEISANASPDPNTGTFQPRAPSSNYTASYYGPESRVMSARGNTGFFPGTKENFGPSARKVKSPEPFMGLTGSPNPEDRESTMTTFPKGVPSAYYANRNAAKEAEQSQQLPKQDMSWLNLGLK